MEFKTKKRLDSGWSPSFPRVVTWGQKNAKKPGNPHTEIGVYTLTGTQAVSLHQQTKSVTKLDVSKPPDPP